MRRPTRLSATRLFALGLLAALTAACTTSTLAKPIKDPLVRIGVIAALTGADQPAGVAQQQAIELAVDQFAHSPGPRFKPIYMNETAGLAGVDALINDRIAAVVGPTHSQFEETIYSTLDIAGVPDLGDSLTVPGLTAFRPYLWRVSLSADRTIPPSIDAAATRSGATTAYILYTSDNLFTIAEKEIFEDALSADSLTLLGESGYLSGQPNLSTVIKKAVASGAQMICVSAESDDAVRVLSDLRAAGFKGPAIGGNGYNSTSVITALGAAANNLYFGSAWDINDKNPESKAFVVAFEARFHIAPDAFAAEAYASMQVLRDAVRLGGPTRSGIESAFGRVGTVRTILGPFSFDISRDADYPAIVHYMINDKMTVIARVPPPTTGLGD